MLHRLFIHWNRLEQLYITECLKLYVKVDVAYVIKPFERTLHYKK